MLTFIGLGLYDERSITQEGADALQAAETVFAEFYTSKLLGATVEEIASYHDTSIEVLDRADVEQDPAPILDAAEAGEAAFLTAGDTMISTTHTDLRVRAADRGIETRVIHGVTAETAASGLTGLQNYRFGKAVTLPFPAAHGGEGVPESVIETIDANRERGLHTLVYLDIKVDSHRDLEALGIDDPYMRADMAAELLATDWQDALAVVVARAGSPEPRVVADRLSSLAEQSFGEPLQLLVIPGELHHVEADALATLADAPEALLPAE